MSVEATIQQVFPGAETMVNISSRLATPEATRGEQARIRAAVKRCRACDEAGIAGERDPFSPVPASYGVHRASFAVIGEAPGAEEVDEGRGFVGVSGRMLRAAMRQAKIGQEAVAWMNTVSCRPTEDGGRNRTPNRDESRMCYGNCADQLWAANTDRVLLVGAKAKDLWRPDLTIEQLEGVVGVMWDRYVVMVVRHPAGIMRAPNKRTLAERLNAHLKLWSEVLGEDDGRLLEGDYKPAVPVTRHMALECVEAGCLAPPHTIDRDGLGWCREHRNDRWMQVRGIGTSGVQRTLDDL